MHKTKFFKKIFEANSDDSMNLKDPRLHVMTQETFVPLLGQMWDKAKARYRKRYKQKALEFVEWAAANYFFTSDHWLDKLKKGALQNMKTTEQLYEIWKNETK